MPIYPLMCYITIAYANIVNTYYAMTLIAYCICCTITIYILCVYLYCAVVHY